MALRLDTETMHKHLENLGSVSHAPTSIAQCLFYIAYILLDILIEIKER